MWKLIFGGVIGAALAYFFDPDNGARRRNMARDQAGARARRSAEQVQDLTEIAGDKAQGVAAQAMRATTKAQRRPSFDDATLAEKVKTELYGSDTEAKGRVVVNAQGGVVQLRGEVETPGQISELEEAVKKIEGVKSVENLLHLPGTPAPTS